MKNTLYSLAFLLVALLPTGSSAQELTPETPEISFYRAVITNLDASTNDFGEPEYTVTAQILNGDKVNESIQIQYYIPERSGEEYSYELGDTIVVSRTFFPDTQEEQWALNDRFRLPGIAFILLAFVALAIVLSGVKRGIAALAGLAFSLSMIVWFMLPQIANGSSPILIGLIGAICIAVASMFLAHGFNKPTAVAAVSTLITVGLTLGISWLSIYVVSLYGTGSEEAYVLQQFTSLGDLNLRGLLLVGMVIGALGVLDDVTTSLTAAIVELQKANIQLQFRDLVASGLRIGREHITSLINTLMLAYAGAALPVLLLFTVDTRPLWVLLNSQFMAEEIIRGLVGSIVLMMAVPITAVLAAFVFESDLAKKSESFKRALK